MYRGSQNGLFESTCLIIKRYILAILSVYEDQYLTTYYSSFLRAISKSMLHNEVCFFLVILLIKNKIWKWLYGLDPNFWPIGRIQRVCKWTYFGSTWSSFQFLDKVVWYQNFLQVPWYIMWGYKQYQIYNTSKTYWSAKTDKINRNIFIMVKQVLSDGPIWLKIVMKGPSPLAVSLLYTCIALK